MSASSEPHSLNRTVVLHERMTGFPADAGLIAILESNGVAPDALLGHGGEAWVYALDHERVIRVLHEGGDADALRRRIELVEELRTDDLPFSLPEVLDMVETEGRAHTIERRLPGRSVLDLLAEVEGRERSALIEAHLDAAAALRLVALRPRSWFGDLLRKDGVRAETWTEYLSHRAQRSLRRAPADFAAIDADALADALPDCASTTFVHLDAFAGNMLAVGTTITAVIDIGPTSVVGDPLLDEVSAAVYLCSSEITPAASRGDHDVARSWLRNRSHDDLYEGGRRWLAAYWSWAVDDPLLQSWCRRVLLAPI
jgi:aminoglycoside phosphotransferase (APT) family kinase protein